MQTYDLVGEQNSFNRAKLENYSSWVLSCKFFGLEKHQIRHKHARDSKLTNQLMIMQDKTAAISGQNGDVKMSTPKSPIQKTSPTPRTEMSYHTYIPYHKLAFCPRHSDWISLAAIYSRCLKLCKAHVYMYITAFMNNLMTNYVSQSLCYLHPLSLCTQRREDQIQQ